MIIIGHRGARGLAPENTLAAIEKGLAAGADEIEIDIRITRGGVPVLNHNRNLPVENGGLFIAAHTYAELKAAKRDLATLTEALAAVHGRAVLYIEVKRGEPVRPVVEAITSYFTNERLDGSILLASKSQKTLRELHRLLPEIQKVVIDPWSAVRARYRARQVGTKRISMRSWWLWRGVIRGLYQSGYQLTPYTMNDPKKVVKWQPYLYGVVTDYPDRFASDAAKPDVVK